MTDLLKLKIFLVTRRIRPRPQGVTFAEDDSLPRRILFFFPITEDGFEQSRHVLRILDQHPEGDFQLAIPVKFRDRMPASTHPVFYFPTGEKKSRHIPVDVLTARFIHEIYDAVINLDPAFNLPIARVIGSLDSPKRMGLSGTGSDLLYNIQIRHNGERPLSEAYDQLLTLCGIDTLSGHSGHHTPNPDSATSSS